ncbi:MAG: zinc ribbon domain-containing protein [Fervidobacterium sp.]|uniref:hypothetical protein n=1 Tax=Fervidobacterium sp. TaxID=1871331 RepID=UPI0025BB04E4|nr:hypothetical protein [Fervidobacterium sp.]NPU90007.1 zinc ribbon domain-containing protein [Fervidobacterium sp.]
MPIIQCIKCGQGFFSKISHSRNPLCPTCKQQYRKEYIANYNKIHWKDYALLRQHKTRIPDVLFLTAVKSKKEELSCYFGGRFLRLDFFTTVKQGYLDGGIFQVDKQLFLITNSHFTQVKSVQDAEDVYYKLQGKLEKIER